MLNLARFLSRLLRIGAARQPPRHPDEMSLRDWADLPPHHPRCDTTPC